MNCRPIGVNHSEQCDTGEWDDLCDDCRAQAEWDCDEEETW